MDRWSRFEKLIGKEAVSFLSKQKVLIIGCGGVGGYTIEALARCAIGHFVLIDYDVVEESNCNRQIIALTSNIGRKKVDCFQNRILEINPTCRVTTLPLKVTEETVFQILTNDLSFVVDACDDVKVKKAILKCCFDKKIPYVASMGTGKKLDPSKLEITTLDKTNNDPLARIMRKYAREQQICDKIWVCASTELPKKTENNVIASCAFVPSTAGLLIASHVVQEMIKKSA